MVEKIQKKLIKFSFDYDSFSKYLDGKNWITPFLVEIRNLKVARRTDSANFILERITDLERTKACILLALVFGLKTHELHLVTSEMVAILWSEGKFVLDTEKYKKFLYLDQNCLEKLLKFFDKTEINWIFAFNIAQEAPVAMLPLEKVIENLSQVNRRLSFKSETPHEVYFEKTFLSKNVQIIKTLAAQQKEMSKFTTLGSFSHIFKSSKLLNVSTALGIHKRSGYYKPERYRKKKEK